MAQALRIQDLKLLGKLYDAGGSEGTNGQILSSTVSGVDWIDLSSISGVTGSGTANYVTKWLNSGAVTNSIIQDNGTNISIGSSNFYDKLYVNGNITVASTSHKIGYADNAGADVYITFDDANPIFRIGAANYSTGGGVLVQADKVTTNKGTSYIQARVLDVEATSAIDGYYSGKLGIGTTDPAVALQIGQLTPTSATAGLQFGDDAATRIYRSASSTLTMGGTFVATTFSGSGASLTNLPAGQLTGTIPSAVLGNSTVYIGSTAVALNRASGAIVLTGITSIDGNAATATALQNSRTLWGQSFNGSANVSGNLTSVGNITGSSAITIAAGGTNQNVTITPSGTGYTLLNGNVGIGTTTPDTSITIDSSAAGGQNTRSLVIKNTLAGSYTVDGLTAYNATTGYKISDSSSFSFFSRVKAGNIFTFASEVPGEPAHYFRFINFDSTSTHALLQWEFNQYDGAGTLATDFKTPDILWRTAVRTSSGFATKLELTGDGKLSIGGATPSYNLDITGNLRSTQDSYFATSSGSVGVGTLSPAAKLHSLATSEQLRLSYDATNYAYFTVTTSGLILGVANSKNLYLRPDGVLYLGDGATDSISIGRTDGVVSTSTVTGIFSAVTTSSTQGLYQNNSANVGIGTTNPTQKLHVNGGNLLISQTATAGTLYLGSTAVSLYRDNTADLVLHQNFASANAVYLGSLGSVFVNIDTNDNDTDKVFAVTTNALKAGTELFRVQEDGNVGIGTTAPTNLLDVNGDARIRSVSASASAASIYLTTDANGVLVSRTAAQVLSDIGAGTGNGTVTSVALSAGTSGTDVNISGSPITGAGTITLNIPDASAAARGLITTGAQTIAGTKTFSSTISGSISGNAANVTGTVAVANGGTGATSFTAGRILFGNGTSAINTSANLFWDNSNSRLGIGTTSPSYNLDIPTGTANIYKLYRSGGIYYTGNRKLTFSVSQATQGDNWFRIATVGSSGVDSSQLYGGVIQNLIMRIGVQPDNTQSNRGTQTLVSVTNSSFSVPGNINVLDHFTYGVNLITKIRTSKKGTSPYEWYVDIYITNQVASKTDTVIIELIEGGATLSSDFNPTVGTSSTEIVLPYSSNSHATVGMLTNHFNSTEQLRLSYDDSNYSSFTVNSAGSLTIAAVNNAADLSLTAGSTVRIGDAPADAVVIGRTTQVNTTTNIGIFSAVTTGSVQGIYQNNSANVGIGTISPSGKLHVVTGTSREVAIGESTAVTGVLRLRLDDNSLSYFSVENRDAGAGANHGSGIRFNFGTNVSATAINAGGIYLAKEQIWTSTTSTQDSYLSFYTALNGSAGEKVRITSDGNVGIGTTAPTNLLDVNGDARIRSVSASASAASIYLTTDANGVLVSRTAAQVRSDIGAGTGNGTVTSVALSAGTSGTDVNISGSPITGAGTITLNIPDASAAARGLITTGAQTIAGTKTFSSTISGSISGNAATVTNGVYTTGSYADPSWITSLAGSKITGNISGNAANVTGTVAVANGGTGATSFTAGRVLFGNGTSAINTSANLFWDNSNSRLGIGITSPTSALNVVETTAVGSRIQLGTSGTSALMDAGQTNDLLILNAPYSSTAGTTSNKGAKWGIKFVGNINNLNSNINTSAIYAVSEDSALGYNRGTSLAFYTNEFNDKIYAERLRIYHNGNVGIGTTVPVFKLDITGNLRSTTGIYTDLISCNTGQQLVLNAGESSGVATGQTNEYVYINAEYGLQINSSPDNWVGGWSVRNTANICGANGYSTFPSNIGIGNSSPSTLLHVGGSNQTTSAYGIQFGLDSSANLYRSASTTIKTDSSFVVGGLITELSSIKYKENISEFNDVLPRIDLIRPVTYNKIGSKNKEYGLIAEEVSSIFPELISRNDENEIDSLNYSRLTVILLQAVKELKAEIEKLKEENKK